MSKNIKLKHLIKEEKNFVNPTCPSCHNYNAMLPSQTKDHGMSGKSTRECRDCGFEAEYSDTEMVDVGNSAKTYKRLDGPDGQLREAGLSSHNYISSAIDDFIGRCDVTSGYKPKIKFECEGASTKWLDVDWEEVSNIAEMLEERGK